MKKKTIKNIHCEAVLRGQRERKQAKQRQRSRKKSNAKDRNICCIFAPEAIDIYHPRNCNKFLGFLHDLRVTVGIRKQTAAITFRDSKSISAAAGLLLLAEVDRLVREYGAGSIKADKPKPVYDQFHRESRVLEAALNQIGFYQLLGQKENRVYKPHNVSCWSVSKGVTTDSATAGRMLESISESIAEQSSRDLYRGSIEALANSVEHGYMATRKDGLNIDDKRWWMFVGVFEGKLAVLI